MAPSSGCPEWRGQRSPICRRAYPKEQQRMAGVPVYTSEGWLAWQSRLPRSVSLQARPTLRARGVFGPWKPDARAGGNGASWVFGSQAMEASREPPGECVGSRGGRYRCFVHARHPRGGRRRLDRYATGSVVDKATLQPSRYPRGSPTDTFERRERDTYALSLVGRPLARLPTEETLAPRG